MIKPLELLGGAFTAELVKGQWKYTPNISMIGKKKEEKALPLKERPQYKLIEQYESDAAQRYQGTLGNLTKEIVTFLKEIK